ncbi:unnamed protein product [Diatraea saccharalis]|uniref:Uncharacterized protein n=1 Tax=Diatraea saccharalis TaxID=40085 RepID=A0A9N9QYP9_9NEOP|nr:unnamed protein product [Diatraea saccharalis]
MIFAPLDLVQDMYYGILGIALFAISGGLVLSARTRPSLYPRTGDPTLALIGGSLAIANAFMMLFDLSLAYLDSEEFEEESEAVSAAADAYIDAWWSACGGALFGMCGALTLRSWREVPACLRRTYAQANAVCSLAAAALLTIDALLAACSAHKDDDASTRTKSKKSLPRR